MMKMKVVVIEDVKKISVREMDIPTAGPREVLAKIHQSNICTTDVHYVVVAEKPVPEFPSVLLPVTMIIGFLGTVLFIRRTREH